MAAGHDRQCLEQTVKIVSHTSVVAVDVNGGDFRIHVNPNVGAAVGDRKTDRIRDWRPPRERPVVPIVVIAADEHDVSAVRWIWTPNIFQPPALVRPPSLVVLS